MCVGRRPYTRNLGLEEMNIKTEKGRIVVNERFQSSVPGFVVFFCVINYLLHG